MRRLFPLRKKPKKALFSCGNFNQPLIRGVFSGFFSKKLEPGGVPPGVSPTGCDWALFWDQVGAGVISGHSGGMGFFLWESGGPRTLWRPDGYDVVAILSLFCRRYFFLA